MSYLKLIFLSVSFLTAETYAQQSLQNQEAKVRQLDSLFTALYQSDQFSGNVLIAEQGVPIYQKSFGQADVEHRLPINEHTRFLLGSVSKQFTAMGIVLLKIAGKLSYEDTLEKYIPELPYAGITIRQLLNHTSGLPDYGPLMQEHWDKTRFAGNADMINMLIRYHPEPFFAPGEHFLYSNTGYALLATIIERVSGLSFQEYMETRLFKPLGMTQTLIYTRRYQPRAVENYALGYVYEDSLKKFVLPDVHPIFKNTLWEDGIYGEDGVNSTIGDLLKWDQALFKGTFIPATELTEVFTPQKPRAGESDYGFGWRVIRPEGKGRIAFHSGGWPGYIAYNEQHLDENRTIIILRNRFTPRTRMPIDRIRLILQNNP